jgi:tRNA-Thr(GGU) m(6)t(6)A37 methyltransferase TsaA
MPTNSSDTYTVRRIGTIESPYKTLETIPIQASRSTVLGRVVVFSEYADGLRDLEGFSHVTVLYRFHLSGEEKLIVKPFLDEENHGVFATRSPKRPNLMGLSTLRLISIGGCILDVEGVDVVDGTPLLDIKPYVPQFDERKADKIGWLANKLF